MAGRSHFENTNHTNSADLKDIFTKFGTEIDTGEPRLPLRSNFTSYKIKMAAAAILKGTGYGTRRYRSLPIRYRQDLTVP